MASAYPHLHVVIICDDAPYDLWPLTRQGSPRDLVTVQGDEASLLARMVSSCLPLTDAPVHIICSPRMVETYRDHLIADADDDAGEPDAGKPARGMFASDRIDLVGVPTTGRSALPLALIAADLKLADPLACILVLRSGIRFAGDEIWEAAVLHAYQAAEKGHIALIGVPSTPGMTVSRHGFIRQATPLPDIDGVFRVAEFTMHPKGSLLARLQNPRTHWYSGISLMRASVLLGEVHARHDLPAPASDIARISDVAGFLASLGRPHWTRPDALDVISTLPAISLEEGVLEASEQLVVVASSLAWQDISSLEAIDELASPDANGNRLTGNSCAELAEGTTVYAGSRLVAALGTKDLLVVDADDVTLIAHKDELDRFDLLVDDLKRRQTPELQEAPVSWFSWGKVEKLRREQLFSAYRVEVSRGAATPRTSRNDVVEQYTVVSGTGRLRIGSRNHHLEPQTILTVKPGEFRSIEADVHSPLVIIMVRTPLP